MRATVRRRHPARALVVGVLVLAAVGLVAPTARRPHELDAAALQVVALGDSVSTGYGCDCASFPEMVTARLRTQVGRPVQLDNDAVNGATSTDLVSQVGQPDVLSHLRSAAVVMVMIGANDLPLEPSSGTACSTSDDSACLAPRLAALRSALQRVVAVVHGASPHAVVALLGYWNVGVDGDVARGRGPDFLTNSRAVTGAVNDVIASVAGATGSLYVDVARVLLGPTGGRDPTDDLQADGDHTDESGNSLLADAVMTALRDSGALGTLRRAAVVAATEPGSTPAASSRSSSAGASVAANERVRWLSSR